MTTDQAWHRVPATSYLPDGPAETMMADPVSMVRRRFPGLVFWYGSRTRSWWAIVRIPSGWRLVEATDADELTQAVLTAATWPYPPALRTVITPKRSGHHVSAFDEKESSMGMSDKPWRSA